MSILSLFPGGELIGKALDGFIGLAAEGKFLDFAGSHPATAAFVIVAALLFCLLFNVGPLKTFPKWLDAGAFTVLGVMLVVSFVWMGFSAASQGHIKQSRESQRQSSGPIQPGFTLPGSKPDTVMP